MFYCMIFKRSYLGLNLLCRKLNLNDLSPRWILGFITYYDFKIVHRNAPERVEEQFCF